MNDRSGSYDQRGVLEFLVVVNVGGLGSWSGTARSRPEKSVCGTVIANRRYDVLEGG